MDPRTFIGTLAGGLVAAPFAVEAQQPQRVPRVGWLSPNVAAMNESNLDAYRQAMRGLGYVEGHTVITVYRFADGRVDHLADLARELVNVPVDVIVTSGTPASLAAK